MIDSLARYQGVGHRPHPGARPGGPPSSVDIEHALDEVRAAPSILLAMHAARAIGDSVRDAARDGTPAAQLLPPVLRTLGDGGDTVAAIAAIHALGRIPGSRAEALLADLLGYDAMGYDAHAAWAMAERPFARDLVMPLAASLAGGGLAGMHAQTVLARWASSRPEIVLVALEEVFELGSDLSARRYAIETVGLVPDGSARRLLMRIATDRDEPREVRRTAIRAFVERGHESLPAPLAAMSRGSDDLAAVVRSVRAERAARERGPRRREGRSSGIAIAQIHLGGVLDEDAAGAGMGDTGGVATLLSRLGAKLLEQRPIAEVTTIGRSADGDSGGSTRVGAQRFERIALEPGDGRSFTSAWPSVVAARRGIRSALLADALPDVAHLRMADPGSLAAAGVMREFGVPTVFTLAADPHGPIDAAERAGELDRRSFSSEDARSRLWFRSDLVERLASGASELVLFPRPSAGAEIERLVGVDLSRGRPRYTIVPEGIDLDRSDAASKAFQGAAHDHGVLQDLDAAVSALPEHRHGLRMVLSVGRLQEMKGMARAVAAFATDERLATTANLVIVGGDLADPSAAEAAELARIQKLFELHDGLRHRVVLLGHRPHAQIGLLMAAARHGRGSLIGPGGAYVCASRKEEFGLAIAEALAAGLPVVAPREGGPSTYVDDRVIGRVVDTLDPLAIASGLDEALELALDPRTAVRARDRIAARYTLERMARNLAAVYRVSAGARSLGIPLYGSGAA